MDATLQKQLIPGAKVEVTQQILHRDRAWTNQVQGEVVSFQQRPTGSWYAHSKNDRLWLDRLTLRKPDGEIITLSLDEYSQVNVRTTESG